MFDGVDMIETILSPGVSAHGETRGYGKGHCGETLVGMGWEGLPKLDILKILSRRGHLPGGQKKIIQPR